MSDSEPDPRRRFLLDHMLGKLAVYLRMCGYDAAYAGDRGLESDDAVRRVAREEGRTVLSRDRELVDSARHAIEIRGHAIDRQLTELRAAGVPLSLADPPRRCGRCNGRLRPAPSAHDRPDYVPDHETDCWRCQECGQYFWKGSHWDDVAAQL